MTKVKKIIGIILLCASLLGFIDATYLTVEHYMGSIPPCTISGCEVVLTSTQSVIVGIPVALLGAIYYLLMFILSIIYLDSKKDNILHHASYFSICGFVASLYFVYLQIFVIDNICQYCMISAFTSTMLFITGMYALYMLKKEKNITNITI